MQLLHSCFAPLVLNMQLLGVLVSAALAQIGLRLAEWLGISLKMVATGSMADGRQWLVGWLLHELGRF